MPQINYSEIDFNTLKQNLIDYITDQSDFTNQNKEGANFNLLVELLAYITNILSYNLNQGINETYLNTAELRSNILKIVKILNYIPVRTASAKATVDITVNEVTGAFGVSKLATLDKIPGGTKDFYYIGPEIEIVSTGGLPTTLSNIDIYNGTLQESSSAYTGDGTQFQSFTIEDTLVSKDYLKIYTVDGTTLTEWTEYDQTLVYSDSAATDYIYFIEEVDNGYKISFGNDKLGRIVPTGEIIGYSYLKSAAKDANGINSFTWSGEASDTLKYAGGVTFNTISDATITTVTQASNGDDKETIDEIKFNAPRFYQTQGRAVTTTDYTSLVLTDPLVDKAKTIGGNELTPIELGKVYVNVKADEDVAGDINLTDAQLATLKTFLEDRSVVTIDVVVQNPQFVYLLPTTILRHTSDQAPAKGSVSSAIDTFVNTSNSEFGDYLEFSQFVAQVDDADSLITSNITTMEIYTPLTTTNIETEDVDGSKIEDGNYLVTLSKNVKTTYTTKIEIYSDSSETTLVNTLTEGVDYTVDYLDDDTGDAGVSGNIRISMINTGETIGIDGSTTGTASYSYRFYFDTVDDDIFLNNNQIFYLDEATYLSNISTQQVSA